MARRRWPKIVGIILIALIVLLSLGITFTIGWRPIIGAKKRSLNDRKFEMTAARMERGRYLVEGVNGCFGCHTDQDWSKPGAPPVAGREGSGHIWADQDLPWLVAPNITPDKETGAGHWSDDAFARAIREGIGHDGRTLFSAMPYQHYREMSDEDLAAIIVYLRSVPPVHNPLPTTKIPSPLYYLMNNMPQPVTSAVNSDLSTTEKRGAYLVSMAACADCHTPQEKGEPIAGMEFAGGFLLHEPKGDVVSNNITPAASGIGYDNEATFIQALRQGKVGARPLRASMPWYFFGKMTDDDLKAIYAYLKTVKPVKHQIDNFEPPTFCRLCKQKHGFGATN
jgi:mono/diheme cytochrome c family protein